MSNPELLKLAAGNGGACRARDVVQERIARWYAKEKGFTKDKGGWIHSADGRTVCQGWAYFYDRMKPAIALELNF